jgi:hypothetical protein
MTSSEIKILLETIAYYEFYIKDSNKQLAKRREELQAICPHENVVELPGITYDGIAKTYAKRFCKVCKLEESARDLNGSFARIKTAHKVIKDINSAVLMAEYIREKDEP